MSNETKIEWADATFNPWIGCTKVSPGCAHCYAELFWKRMGVEKGRRRTIPATWKQVERWNRAGLVCPECSSTLGADRDCDCGAVGAGTVTMRRLRVFPSLCDPFDPEVPIEWLADYLDLIWRTPNLDHLLLTKRPEQWESRIKSAVWDGRPPHNLWLGVSAEDQQRWDERRKHAEAIPARVRFVSYEPALSSVKWNWNDKWHLWIAGGESGPRARPCNVEWIRDGLRQCREAGVKAFVKQLGSRSFDGSVESKLLDAIGMNLWNHPKGGDPDEWPEDLRVRETPCPAGR